MKAWKRVLTHTLLSATLLGSALHLPARAQITEADIQAAKQKYVHEFLPCTDMSTPVRDALAAEPGSDWTEKKPGEWYVVANLTRAIGCGRDSEQVQARLREALDFIKGKPGITRNSENWWHLDVGVPRALAEALIRGGRSVPAELRLQMEKALAWFIDQQGRDEQEGANAIWRAWAKLVAGFYFEDVGYAQSAYDLMITSTNQGKHNHIAEEWSYSFHQRILNMHYGGQHFAEFVDYLKFSEGTAFSLQARKLPYDTRTGVQIGLQWLENFLRWIYYKDGLADPYTVTKFPHWQGSYGGRIESGSRQLAQTSYAQEEPYRTIIKNIAAGSAQPLGARAFPQSRYLVVRRNNFFASLIMANLAVPQMEASTFAPIFGAVNIVAPSSYKKWEEKSIMRRPQLLLNAMTAPVAYEEDTHQADVPVGRNPGGHSDQQHKHEIYNMIKNWGYYGVATLAGYYGMGAEQLAGRDDEFTFKRSWFFFDDEAVCLGSGITSKKAEVGGIRTFLYSFTDGTGGFQSPNGNASVPLVAGEDVALGQLSWLHHKGMGYFFPTAMNVRAQGLDTLSRVYLDHGITPSDASFAAVLLPTFSQSQTQAYTSNPNVEVLQCDKAAHVVRHKNSNVTGIAAFEPIDTPALKTNLTGYVLYQNASGKFHLSLYNPFLEERLAGKLGVEKENPMFDADVDGGHATYYGYRLQVPFRLKKEAGKEGMDLFEVKEVSGNRTEVQVYLRVYRKFEIAGVANGDGSITINKAWIAWNDAALNESTTTPATSLPPVAVPGGPYIIRAGETLTLDASRSYDPDGGNLANYEWRFENGTTAAGASVSRQYAAAGEYQANLEVTDDEGEKHRADFTVTIQPQPSAGENIRVLVSGDDKYELYINGARMGSNASWYTAEEYTAPLIKGKNVVALKAENWDQAGAVLAEVYAQGEFWPSDTKWKVSVTEENGWQGIDFNDGNWSAATSHGLHGSAHPWVQFQSVGGISTHKNVHWIWSADKRQEHVVYFRFVVPIGIDVKPPATPTGLRALSQ